MAFEGADEADPEKRANALSQAMRRHGARLMQLNVIMRENPYLWLTGRRVRGFSKRDDTADRRDQLPPPADPQDNEGF